MPQITRTLSYKLIPESNLTINNYKQPTVKIKKNPWKRHNIKFDHPSQFTIVYIISTPSLISIFSSLFSKPLETVPSAPTTIGITVTFINQSFFTSLARSKDLSFHFHSFSLGARLEQISPQDGNLSTFLSIYTRSGSLSEIGWFVCISKSERILWVSFRSTDSSFAIYYLFVWSTLSNTHSHTHTRIYIDIYKL